MPTYFPCDPGAETSPPSSTLCIKCVLDQNPNDACTSSSSSNSSSNESSCDTYCNTGCNTKCTDSYSQTVCGSGHQTMHAHPDVGEYPGETIIADVDYIYDKWTASFFAALNSRLTKAEEIGYASAQGSNGSFANPEKGEIITAAFYNSVEQKLAGFDGGSYPTVKPDDLITAAIANAIGTAYNAAQFKTSVCDVCNSSQHIGGTCGCNCSCACACNCGCSCPCGCSCSCSCGCSCGSPDAS